MKNWLRRPIDMAAETKLKHSSWKGWARRLTAMRKAATDDEPLAIYYAFKQSEAAEDGITSAGWASFLQAVVDAAWSLTALGRFEPKARADCRRKDRMLSPPPLSSSAASALRRRDHHSRRVHPRAEARTARRDRRHPQGRRRPGRHAAIGDRPGHGRILALRQGARRRRQRHAGEDRAVADQPRLGRDRERTRRQFRRRDAGGAGLVRHLRLRRASHPAN